MVIFISTNLQNTHCFLCRFKLQDLIVRLPSLKPLKITPIFKLQLQPERDEEIKLINIFIMYINVIFLLYILL